MCSRYTAFARGDEDHLFRTWWPRTRPEGPYCGPGTTWTGLTIHETVGGGAEEPDAAEAVVEFTARYEHRAGAGSAAPARATGTQPGAMRERSLSRRRAGRWFYVEAL